MTAARRPLLIPIDEYLAGEERASVKHEYLGGVLHAMSGGTNDHAAISANAIVALGSRLRGSACRPFTSDAKIRIEFPDHTRFYYADALVVCDPASGTEHFQERPVVVLEVLSDSTRRTDLGEKRDAYLTIASLKALLFVEPEQALVLVYRRRADGGFAAEEHEGLAAVVELPELGIELPLRELYERIAFRGSLDRE